MVTGRDWVPGLCEYSRQRRREGSQVSEKPVPALMEINGPASNLCSRLVKCQSQEQARPQWGLGLVAVVGSNVYIHVYAQDRAVDGSVSICGVHMWNFSS